jgi:hypothetical protein
VMRVLALLATRDSSVFYLGRGGGILPSLDVFSTLGCCSGYVLDSLCKFRLN